MSNSTTSRGRGKSNSEKATETPSEPEFHARQFRGTFAPVVLHDLVENRRISFAAAWLVMVIDSLSRNGKGCFASNEYLGKKMHLSMPQIKRLLGKLETVGVLWSGFAGKQRFLKIAWAGECEKRRAETYRSENRSLQKRLKNEPSEGSKMSPVNGALPYKGFSKEEEKGRRRAVDGCNGSNNVESFDMKFARFIHDKVRTRLINEPRMSSWAEAVGKMVSGVMKRDSIPQNAARAHVETILKDHLDHLDSPFQPQIYGPWSMQKAFPKLEALRRNRQQKPDLKKVKVTPEAENLVKILTDGSLHWPKGSDARLPQPVQASLDNYRDFAAKLATAAKSEDKRTRSLANHVRSVFRSPRDFVLEWFRKLNDSVQNWQNWHGTPEAFSPSSPRFETMGRELAQDYCGKSKRWDDLLEAMGVRS